MKEQINFENFKLILSNTIEKEKNKLENLNFVKNLLNDKNLNQLIEKRQKFFDFCNTFNSNIQNINNYNENPKMIDKSQKDFYLESDSLKKESLKLMAKNQKMWFEKLYANNFNLLKSLLRSLLINETQNDLTIIERVIQEIELVRYKDKS